MESRLTSFGDRCHLFCRHGQVSAHHNELELTGIIDRDGTIDIVFPTCKSVSKSGIGTDCAINIAYNKQKPLCTQSAGSLSKVKDCRDPDNLCTSDRDFKFNFDETPDNNVLFMPTFRGLPLMRIVHVGLQPNTFRVLVSYWPNCVADDRHIVHATDTASSPHW